MGNHTFSRAGARWVSLGAFFAMTAVILGAFGAHGLKGIFNAQQMAWYNTAFEYHVIHASALIITGLLTLVAPTHARLLGWAAMGFLLGILVFSGSLYALAFTQIRILGAITPFGGVAFIVGWGLLTLAGWQLAQGSQSHD